MEDGMIYSTVIFKSSANVKPEVVRQAEDVVYSDIRREGEAPSYTCTGPTAETPAADNQDVAVITPLPYRQATVRLGLLCLVLFAGLLAVSILCIIQGSHYSTLMVLYNNESTAHQTSQAARSSLEREKAELTEQKDQLDKALRIIAQFTRVTASAFCQRTDGEIHCEPCLKDWIQYGSSCYFFYTGNSAWRTREWSQEYCINNDGNLASIDSTEEQEFINQHTPNYYDQHHGYWIGLSKTNENYWIWTTGTRLETGLWKGHLQPSYDGCVLSQTSKVVQQSWMVASCYMLNRWICEMPAVPWQSQMKGSTHNPPTPPPYK